MKPAGESSHLLQILITLYEAIYNYVDIDNFEIVTKTENLPIGVNNILREAMNYALRDWAKTVAKIVLFKCPYLNSPLV